MNLIKKMSSANSIIGIDYYYVDGADITYMQNANYHAVYANLPGRQIERYCFANTAAMLNNEFTETFVLHAISSWVISQPTSNKQSNI